jgi:tRNA(adenine34) deaminase
MVSPAADLDRRMMQRCIDLTATSGAEGEYPYAAVVCRGEEIVFETINRVARDHDVTRHAEVVAVSEAQRVLGRLSLEDCTLYANAEPCALCSYAIRESRVGKLVFALRSPIMGGLSRWNILEDEKLSGALPEVFAAPPELVVGLLREEAERAMMNWDPFAWRVVRHRGLFGGRVHGDTHPMAFHRLPEAGLGHRIGALLRRHFFDRFGRGSGRMG